MARVFTITPGLENMGAMKTGGQGSVYKARRTGEIITAVKILPTPIHSESADDRNYIAFQNEVNKLRKVNQTPNPNIVKFLNSGLTDTGNLPFIEMEYIEGPDLEDLLKPPHDPVFTVKEVIKVAEQLSNALAHCHASDIKHGDIKSNNVKYNSVTGNYVLLDFGLAIMSDEQRRTSMRQAGAIEFMAPEQNAGEMLFQTDVYSYGVILFELLAGTVPFPLEDKGETARNEVRLAHMANAVPDVLALRRKALPENWDGRKREQEMQVPEWLIKMIYKCLQKKPDQRFANGVELQQFITGKHIQTAATSGNSEKLHELKMSNERLKQNLEDLHGELLKYRQDINRKDDELLQLKSELRERDNQIMSLSARPATVAKSSSGKTVSYGSFVILLIITAGLGAFMLINYFQNISSEQADNSAANNRQKVNAIPAVKKENKDSVAQREETKPRASETQTNDAASTNDDSIANNEKVKPSIESPVPVTRTPESAGAVLKKYRVISKAYFYTEPDEATRQNKYIPAGEANIVEGINERYGFVYINIKNSQGQSVNGWLRKKDLALYSID